MSECCAARERSHWQQCAKPVRAGSPTPLRRWLVASLLKSTKIWCQALLNATAKYDVALPAYALDLPDVVAAIEG